MAMNEAAATRDEASRKMRIVPRLRHFRLQMQELLTPTGDYTIAICQYRHQTSPCTRLRLRRQSGDDAQHNGSNKQENREADHDERHDSARFPIGSTLVESSSSVIADSACILGFRREKEAIFIRTARAK